MNFIQFFKNQFPFFVKWYLACYSAQWKFDKSLPHLRYIYTWGIAESLQEPLLLASVNYRDDDQTIKLKLDFVARYIEIFTVRRSVNSRKFGQTTIKYTMFNVVKLIRNNSREKLSKNLVKEVNQIPETWQGVHNLVLNQMNKRFIKHFLSRISSYIDNVVGKNTIYDTYHNPDGKHFEIEHIWANKFKEHRDEFDQENEFSGWRNSIGALILLPQGTNQSFNSDKYPSKLEHYIKENTYAQTLHPNYYVKNPNFLKSEIIKELGFKPHPEFKKLDIDNRIELVKNICEHIWSSDYFLTD